MSSLQDIRRQFKPVLPSILTKDVELKKCESLGAMGDKEKIQALFPYTYGMPRVEYQECEKKQWHPINLGIVLSGGQAPGGHNVIAGAYDFTKKVGGNMYGFRFGPRGVVAGDYVKITDEMMDRYRNMGGFDMLCSGRDKIKTKEQFEATAKICEQLELDGLIVIGGDDSNTNAALVAEYFASINHRTKVVGCPKTIDGDLKNSYIPISFGFDTATKIYSEMIGNICTDCWSAQKYYHFIKLMGRSASHITMECAFQTHPNVTLIGEEVAEKSLSVKEITDLIVDVVVKRWQEGKNFGVVVMPEGMIEFIPEMGNLIEELNDVIAAGHTEQSEMVKYLSEKNRALFEYLPEMMRDQLTLGRDSHGNVKVSQIETEKFFAQTVAKELDQLKKEGKYGGSFNYLCHFFGYEGRCGMPSTFDAEYCYALGYNASILVHEGANGMISTVSDLERPVTEWSAGGVPITMMMDIERRNGKDEPVIKKAYVNLEGKPFKVFKEIREEWKLNESYVNPGPVQFFGPTADNINRTLQYEMEERKENMSN